MTPCSKCYLVSKARICSVPGHVPPYWWLGGQWVQRLWQDHWWIHLESWPQKWVSSYLDAEATIWVVSLALHFHLVSAVIYLGLHHPLVKQSVYSSHSHLDGWPWREHKEIMQMLGGRWASKAASLYLHHSQTLLSHLPCADLHHAVLVILQTPFWTNGRAFVLSGQRFCVRLLGWYSVPKIQRVQGPFHISYWNSPRVPMVSPQTN